MEILTRDIVRDKLKSILNVESFLDTRYWLRSRYLDLKYEFDDWEENERDSVIVEILRAFGDEAFYIIRMENIPACLEFLDTPKGKFKEAHAKWAKHFWNEPYGYYDQQKTVNRGPFNNCLGFSYEKVKRIKGKIILDHRTFGEIPIHALYNISTSGEEYTFSKNLSRFDGYWSLSCDVNYLPPLPPNAVRANVELQNIVSSGSSYSGRYRSFGVPVYFYQECSFFCKNCELETAFTISDQQHCYENNRLPTYVTVNRCAACNTLYQLNKKLSHIGKSLKQEPQNLGYLFEDVRIRVRIFELTGKAEGNLDHALGIVRRLRRSGYNPKQSKELEDRITQLRIK